MAEQDTAATLALVKGAMRQTMLEISEEYGTHLTVSIDLFSGDPFEPANPAADAFAAGVAQRLGLIVPEATEE